MGSEGNTGRGMGNPDRAGKTAYKVYIIKPANAMVTRTQ